MTTQRMLEKAIVVSLLLVFLGLWRAKRAGDIRRSGVDPHVLGRAATSTQIYFAVLMRLIGIVVIGMVVLHAAAPVTWAPVVRWQALDAARVDWLGGAVGLAGLALCALAQLTMGGAWRVGIDHERSTDLVTSGIYRLVRNPTYVGIFVTNAGIWLVWPTTLVAAYAVLVFVIMEMQVRCEEEHLVATHGDAFTQYARRSWRYVPWVY